MNIKKIVSFIAVVFVFGSSVFASNKNVRAITFETGDTIPGNAVTIDVLADPIVRSQAVQVRLSVTGGIVNSFIPNANSGLLTLGTCSGGNYYSKNEVCFDAAVTEDVLSKGEVLGKMTVYPVTTEELIKIEKLPTNVYFTENGQLEVDEGTIFPFREVQPVKTETNYTSYLLISLFLLIITVLLIIIISIVHKRKDVKEKYHVVYNEENIAKLSTVGLAGILFLALAVSFSFSSKYSTSPVDINAQLNNGKTVVNVRAVCDHNPNEALIGDVVVTSDAVTDQKAQNISSYKFLIEESEFNVSFESTKDNLPIKDIIQSSSGFQASSSLNENTCLFEEFYVTEDTVNSGRANSCQANLTDGALYLTFVYYCE